MDYLSPLLELGIRLYLAGVFWRAGMTKIASWDTTLALFEYEYSVPLLAPGFAAVLATAVELVTPVLLVAGLGGRLTAIALFAFNIVAAIAYPDISVAGLKDHYLWGALLLVLIFHGPGKISLDRFIAKRFNP